MSGFQKFQNVRDFGAVFLALGALCLSISSAYLLFSVVGGYGIIGWLGYGIGPIGLFVGAPSFLLGLGISRRAKRMKNGLDKE